MRFIALLILIGAVPLVWAPGFNEEFVVPREAFVLAILAPVAAFCWWRDDGARRSARMPLLALLVALVGGLVPHLVGVLDPYGFARFVRLVSIAAALVIAGAGVGGFSNGGRWLVVTLGLSSVPVLVVGLVRRHLGWPALLPDRPDVALGSTLGNSNALGETFAPILMAAIAMALARAPRTTRVLSAVGAVGSAALVALSQSRGAWLACAVSGVVAITLWVRDAAQRDQQARPGPVARAALALAAIGVVACTLAWLPAAGPLRERIASTFSPDHPTNLVRLSTWRGTLPVIGDSFPTGVGGGGFERAFLPHRDTPEWLLSGIDTRVDNPHQEFLWITAEAGLLGLAALLWLAALALRRARTPAIGEPELRRALLLGGIAFGVVACVRSPLHHAGGALAVAALIGAVGPRGPGRGGLRVVDGLALALLALAAAIALLNAREDRALGSAVDALNTAKGALHAARTELARDSILEAGRGIRGMRQAVVKDFARSFRASLAAGELAEARTAMAAAGIPQETFADLPTLDDARALLEETLALCPNHPGATNQLARLWLSQGSTAQAVSILRDAIEHLPNAPRFRHNLAAIYGMADLQSDAFDWMQQELNLQGAHPVEDRLALWSFALALGSEPRHFGRYLVPIESVSTTDDVLDAAAGAVSAGQTTDARARLLEHVYLHPGDGRVLARLAEVDFAAGQRQSDTAILTEANRAFARSRVRFAVQAEADGDHEQAEVYLKLALQKDANLLDALFLRARVLTRLDRMDDAMTSLKRMLDRGVAPADLRTLIINDAVLNPRYADKRFSALGI